MKYWKYLVGYPVGGVILLITFLIIQPPIFSGGEPPTEQITPTTIPTRAMQGAKAPPTESADPTEESTTSQTSTEDSVKIDETGTIELPTAIRPGEAFNVIHVFETDKKSLPPEIRRSFPDGVLLADSCKPLTSDWFTPKDPSDGEYGPNTNWSFNIPLALSPDVEVGTWLEFRVEYTYPDGTTQTASASRIVEKRNESNIHECFAEDPTPTPTPEPTDPPAVENTSLSRAAKVSIAGLVVAGREFSVLVDFVTDESGQPPFIRWTTPEGTLWTSSCTPVISKAERPALSDNREFEANKAYRLTYYMVLPEKRAEQQKTIKATFEYPGESLIVRSVTTHVYGTTNSTSISPCFAPTPEPPTPEPTATQTPQVTGTYVDIGAEGDSVDYGLLGFLPTKISGRACTLGGFDDRTIRSLDHTTRKPDGGEMPSVIRIPVTPGVPVTITVCAESGGTGNGWTLNLGGGALGRTGCDYPPIAEQQDLNSDAPPEVATIGPITIKAHCLPDDKLVLAFADRTGDSPIWGILVQQDTSPTPTEEPEPTINDQPTIAPRNGGSQAKTKYLRKNK